MRHPEKPSSRRRALAVAALAVIGSAPLALTSAAQASPVGDLNGGGSVTAASTVGLPFGQWTLFEVGKTGSFSDVYRFTSDTPVMLRVTDAYCRGDEFRVLDRGSALFATSTVATDPSCDDQPDVETGGAAWRDASYSKGRFLLQPGHHWVRIQITDSPFSAAGAYLRIDKRPVG
jgi:hypothetical protein